MEEHKKSSLQHEHTKNYEILLDNHENDDDDARLIELLELKKNTTLTNLELKHVIIHDKGARVLGAWLEQNVTLKILQFSYCQFKDKSFSLFGMSLAQNSSLVELHVYCMNAINRGAMTNKLTAMHMEVSSSDKINIASFIKQNHSLTKLVLYGVALSSEGAKLVAESLKHNSSLTHLDIGYNDIGNDGTKEIAESLKHNSLLTCLQVGGNIYQFSLDLHEKFNIHIRLGNAISDEQAQYIAEMIEENHSLTKLFLAGISELGENMIRKAARLNGWIGEITFKWQRVVFHPVNTEKITETFADSQEELDITSCIKSESEQLWYNRINFIHQDSVVSQLPIRAILQDLLQRELKALSTKLFSPIAVLLDGASSTVALALVTDLKRPFIVLTHTYGYKSLLSLLHKCNESQLIVLIQNVNENISAIKEFIQQVKESKIKTRCLTIIGIAEESNNNIATLFDHTIKVCFNTSTSIYEYLMATVYMSKHSTLSVQQMQGLAERFAGCKKERGSGLIAQLKNSLRSDINLSPADIDSIFIEASILSLSRGLNVPSVTLADVESVLEKSKTSIYQGKPKPITELVTIEPQESNVMKSYFNFLLRQQRIHVEWIDEITEQLTVSVAKLIGLHYEVLKHLQSINVPQHQIWCYRLRINCDTWTWKLGNPVFAELPKQENNNTPTREVLLENEVEFLREEVKQIEKYKQEYKAAVSLVKRSISDFPYEELVFEEQIGEGTFGNVRRALWHNQKVAVKRFKLNSIDSPMTVLDEAKTLAHVRHKHIVLLMGTTTMPGTNETMLVLEYMKHGSLHDLLVKKVKLERSEIIQLATDIAKGLDHLHSLTPRIIHRDLKPQNILLYQKGKRAKLTDFGTAKWFNKDTILSSGVGTVGFMAPEVLAWVNYDEKVDIFSFGVVLFKMVSGEGIPPVIKKSARKQLINNAIKNTNLADIKQLVLDCCQEDPTERPNISDIVKRFKNMK